MPNDLTTKIVKDLIKANGEMGWEDTHLYGAMLLAKGMFVKDHAQDVDAFFNSNDGNCLEDIIPWLLAIPHTYGYEPTYFPQEFLVDIINETMKELEHLI